MSNRRVAAFHHNSIPFQQKTRVNNCAMEHHYRKIERGIFGAADFQSFQKCPVNAFLI